MRTIMKNCYKIGVNFIAFILNQTILIIDNSLQLLFYIIIVDFFIENFRFYAI